MWLHYVGKAFICGTPVVSDGITNVRHSLLTNCADSSLFPSIPPSLSPSLYLSLILPFSFLPLPNQGSYGMKYSLISRDWVADSVEIMHEAYFAVGDI